MKPIVEHWQPQNHITCPMEGDPLYASTGIIKAVMKTGDKVSVGEIAYEEYEEENFQYRISPYWDIIDGLPENVFHGIPGIDLDLRLKHYYRVNYIPTFITERTPSKNREDLWELLESVGLDYYDRFEWLLRTDMRCANDNLIVERKRKERMENSFSEEKLGELQYGDCLKIHALEDLGSTAHKLSNHLYQLLIRGVDLCFTNGDVMIDCNTRTPMVSVAVTKRLLEYQEYMTSRKKGIDRAKKEGKYKGRKPIEVDEHVFQQVVMEWKEHRITLEEAMERANIASRSTFYRRLKHIIVKNT